MCFVVVVVVVSFFVVVYLFVVVVCGVAVFVCFFLSLFPCQRLCRCISDRVHGTVRTDQDCWAR